MPFSRRHLALFFGVSLVVLIAARLLFAQPQTGSYAPGTLGKLDQSAPAALTEDSRFAVSAYPLYVPELAEGEGRAETDGFCNLCHSTRYITMQPPLPAATWEAEVNKMRKTLGAPIPDAAAAKIIRYLQTHYTPETRKQ